MPGAPRFTQKPSIQQTPQGDLLMECHLEADPPPDIVWHHAGTPIPAGPRVTLTLTNLHDNLYKAILIIKEPNVGDGGAYKCTASNQFGESNANINLNFAGEYFFFEPNVADGGAYKCTASNQFGESNANINLNFAGEYFFFFISLRIAAITMVI
uniref:Ig-like domain-containing protein n=1 Tax=Ascaris lumbricoides TaxID=6252 RepID=A0A0M3IE81_ASCLU